MERGAYLDCQEILECQGKMERLDYLENLVTKETLADLESLVVWDHLDRRVVQGRWEYQVQLVQRVSKEI